MTKTMTMPAFENRGRGKLLKDRPTTLGAICWGIKQDIYQPTHYLRGQLEKYGFATVPSVPQADGGRAKKVIKLTAAGAAKARRFEGLIQKAGGNVDKVEMD